MKKYKSMMIPSENTRVEYDLVDESGKVVEVLEPSQPQKQESTMDAARRKLVELKMIKRLLTQSNRRAMLSEHHAVEKKRRRKKNKMSNESRRKNRRKK